MSINLSDLTSPNNQDVLAEITSAADFLDPIGKLKNLSRSPSKGGDALQTVALNQPKALPLIDGDGYLYLPNVTGNAPAVTIPSISANEDFVFEMEVYLVDATSFHLASGSDSNNRLAVHSNAFYFAPESRGLGSPLSTGASTLTVERSGTTATLKQDGVTKATITGISSNAYNFTHLSHNGQFSTSIGRINGYIQKATLSIEGTEVFNCDFTATNVRHGDTKFKCATGQVVTINQSGNDPATIIKKPVLRFDGVGNFMDGVFNQTITDGYLFAAFSVLGGGGDAYGRLFSANSTGGIDNQNGGFALRRYNLTDQIQVLWNGGSEITHSDVFNGKRGDFLLESPLRAGDQNSKINNADADDGACVLPNPVSSEEFKIAAATSQDNNPAIDLEYLALFDASITDAQADAVRNFINNRNNVFLRHDTDGYYFYDAQKAPVGNISSGSASWNGRIVGSDNGDTDKYATQGVSNDQPVSDGYVVTFADNTDHLDIPSTTQAGWQVVGTSLGTFAYRVNANAVTELNLLGNLGNASYRKAGDLYGIILLPESATGRDINEAKKLLTDRGASESSIGGFSNAWRDRQDIVQFDGGDMSSVTDVSITWYQCSSLTKFSTPLPSVTHATNAWRGCTSLTSFSSNISSATSLSHAWYGCSSLSDFKTTDIRNGTAFTSAWQLCSALTSFPSDALLGTAANNVNFQDAWRDSGLTSFSTPLPTATGFTRAWLASSLTSFNLDSLPEGTAFSATWQQNSLSSFHTELPKAISAEYAWYNNPPLTEFTVESLPECITNYWSWRNCNLTSFSTSLPKTRQVSEAWRNNSNLTDFSAEVFANWNPSAISTYVFHDTWIGCTSLTAQSVENILVSIDASGKYATSTGASGGTALTDAGIDIDYNGDPLSAATTAAITSLKSKGWSIFINSVEQ